MAEMQTVRPGNVPILDSIRTFEAVVLGHARNVLPIDFSPSASALAKPLYFVSGFGHQAVIIFFVLSGYWISQSVTGRWALKDFLIDRLARLSVVLLPALVIRGLLDVSIWPRGRRSSCWRLDALSCSNSGRAWQKGGCTRG